MPYYPSPAGGPDDQTPNAVRDMLLNYFTEHEKTCTTSGVPGTPCWNARISVLAFLCHSLGVRGAKLYTELAAGVTGYDERCHDPQCKHEMN